MKNNQIMDNTHVEELLVLFKQDPSSDSWASLLQAVAASNMLQPCLIEKKENGKDSPKPIIMKVKAGNSYFPFFTSPQQIPAEAKFPGMMSINMLTAMKFLFKSDIQLDGFVINPHTHNILLRREVLERIVLISQAGKPAENLSFTDRMMRVALPKMFFVGGKDFLDSFSGRNTDGLAEIFGEYAEKENGSGVYRSEDFEVMTLNLREDLQHLHIGFGEDFMDLGIYSDLFFFLNPITGKKDVFLIENGKKGRICYRIREDNIAEQLPETPQEGSELYTLTELI